MDTAHFNNKIYKSKYLCFACKKIFKRKILEDICSLDQGKPLEESDSKCPDCGNVSKFVGSKFRAPKKEDITEWEILKVIFDITPDGHYSETFGHLYSKSDNFIFPRSKLSLIRYLKEYKMDLQKSVENLVRADFSNTRKDVIKFLSDKITLIDYYLKK